MTDRERKLIFIKTQDPDSAARLERLLGKREKLQGEGNIYGEKFTGRQFSLVFDPLIDAALERAQVLEILSKGDDTIPGISSKLGLRKDRIFAHIKELMKRNLVEITNHEGNDAVFRRKL
jgi:hypothetical protein